MAHPVVRYGLPSVVAASCGALVAGGAEALRADGIAPAVCAGGLVALVMFPVLLAGALAVRGLWRAWQPQRLSLVEPDGTAPRLAAWLLTILLGACALALAVFATTRQLAASTTFSPLVVSFVEPAAAVVAVVALVALSRPLARGLAYVLARIRRLTPLRIAVTIGVAIGAGALVGWWLVIRPALGALDVSVLATPLAGIACAVLVHACWRMLPGRVLLLASSVLGIAAAIAAVAFRFTNPVVLLSVWGDLPVAGLVVDKVFDVDGIHRDIPASAFEPQQLPGARHRDIVIITIDTVRADHTPPYGGHAEMPTLAELAAQGAVFDWAFSPSNVTRRSIPSMMLGLQPNRVHGRVVGWALRIDPRHVMLAERMRAGGYETAGFMCCDGFWGPRFNTGLGHGLDHLELEKNGLSLARRARDWLAMRLRRHESRPLFLWMHVLEPHNWTAFGPEPHTDAERNATYDRSLVACDGMLKEVLSVFDHLPPDQRPIVIVTADHGEGLGEHDHPNHSTDLFDSQIHVPLVITGPGISHARIGETVSLTDLAPTVLELAGFAPTNLGFDGPSFAPLATAARAPDPAAGIAFAQMVHDRSNPGGIDAVVAGGWKLIKDHGDLHLFDVHADPDERVDLVASRPDIVGKLRPLLDMHERAGKHSPFEP